MKKDHKVFWPKYTEVLVKREDYLSHLVYLNIAINSYNKAL